MSRFAFPTRGAPGLLGWRKGEKATGGSEHTAEILQSTIRGLVALPEVELQETHRLIFGQKGSHPYSASNCPSRTPTNPTALKTYQRVFDHIVASSRWGQQYRKFQSPTRIMEVISNASAPVYAIAAWKEGSLGTLS